MRNRRVQQVRTSSYRRCVLDVTPMADTMTLTEARDLLGVALAHGGSHISVHRTPARNAYDAIDAAIKQRERDAKDAARYRWLLRDVGRAVDLLTDAELGGMPAYEIGDAIDSATAKESGNE